MIERTFTAPSASDRVHRKHALNEIYCFPPDVIKITEAVDRNDPQICFHMITVDHDDPLLAIVHCFSVIAISRASWRPRGTAVSRDETK